MVISNWRKKSIEEQTTKNLKYNLKVGNMSKETENFIKSVIKSRKK